MGFASSRVRVAARRIGAPLPRERFSPSTYTCHHVFLKAVMRLSPCHQVAIAPRAIMRTEKLPVEAFVEYTFWWCISHFKGMRPPTGPAMTIP